MDRNSKFKLLFTAVSSYVVGHQTGLKIEGSHEKVSSLKEAANASRALYNSLNSPDVSLNEVLERIEAKNVAALRFKRYFSVDWPL